MRTRQIAATQFVEQMLPFALELPACNGETARRARNGDPLGREAIAALPGLFMNRAQILADATDRRRVRAKPKELRMMLVAPRLAPEHGLCEQRFPPESHESLSVEILRMQAPNSH